MNRRFALLALAGMLLVIGSWTVMAASGVERGEAYIGNGYVVGGVKLKEGKYLVVHDESKLKEGAACTYFYKMPYRANQKAAAEVHCTPQEGARADAFTMKSTRQADGTNLVSSIQFAGSTSVHVLASN